MTYIRVGGRIHYYPQPSGEDVGDHVKRSSIQEKVLITLCRH